MNTFVNRRWLALLFAALLYANQIAGAATLALASAPLANSLTAVVLPNIMYVLDDSGSMSQDYTPDYINGTSICWNVNNTPRISDSNTRSQCLHYRDMPWSTSDINYQYYNPTVRYQAPVRADGSSYADITPTAAPYDAFGILSYPTPPSPLPAGTPTIFADPSPIDLTTQYWHQVWCKYSSSTPTVGDPTAGGDCQENIDTSGNNVLPSNVYVYQKQYQGPPFYFKMSPFEYCADTLGKVCTPSTTPTAIAGVSYNLPSLYRWCASYNATTHIFSGCQFQRDSGHTIPNYLGVVASTPAPAVKASAALTVTAAVNGLQITSLTINGTNIFFGGAFVRVTATGADYVSGAATAFTGSSNEIATARALCRAIKTNAAVSGWDVPAATTLANCATSITTPTIVVTSTTAGAANNNLPVVVAGPAGAITINSVGSLTVTSPVTSGATISQLSIHGNNLLNQTTGTVTAAASVDATAQSICNAINGNSPYGASPSAGVYQARSNSTTWGTCNTGATGKVEIQRISADGIDNGQSVSIIGPTAIATATAPAGTITINSTSGATRIDDITAGGVSILTGSKPVFFTNGTSTTNIATALAASIGNGFTATSSNNVITVTSTTVGPTDNGKLLAVVTTPDSPTATITVGSNGSSNAADLGGITVNGVQIVGHLTNTDIIDGTATTTNAQTITTAINNGSTGFAATRSGNIISVTAPTGSSFNSKPFVFVSGSSNTGQPSWTFNITGATTNGMLINSITCNGIDTIKPGTVTTGSSGSTGRTRVNNLRAGLISSSNWRNSYSYSCTSIPSGNNVPPNFSVCNVTGPVGVAACTSLAINTDATISTTASTQTSPGGAVWANFAPALSGTTFAGGHNAQSASASILGGGANTNPGTIGASTANMTVGSSGTGTIITNATSPNTLFTSGGQDALAVGRFGTGIFKRTDIVSTTTSYPKGSDRVDCAGASCTYTEELQNFANWYSYYRTRLNMMKTTSTLAFSNLDGSRFRIGFDKLSNSGNSSVVRPVGQFIDNGEVTNQRTNWWSSLVNTNTPVATPLRAETAKIGRYFAGQLSTDPMTYSCQQNFMLLVTDGYWNEDESSLIERVDGSDIGNVDNDTATSPRPAYDGGVAPTGCPAVGNSSRSGFSSCRTLADVTRYYYMTDLRQPAFFNTTNALNGQDVSAGNVKTSASDGNKEQHMVFFAMGLGVSGNLTFSSTYETDNTGDFASIKAGTLNWPAVANLDPTAVDDLWHATVNAHGKYFSARDPKSVASGLSGALSRIESTAGAASAAATSNLQPVPGDNFAYVASYATVEWVGDLQSRAIDVSNNSQTAGTVSSDSQNCGAQGSGCAWSAQAQIDQQNWSARNIYVAPTSRASGAALRLFTYANLNATEQGYFNPSSLSQYATVFASDPSYVTASKLVDYLRGDRGQEANGASGLPQIWRARSHILGDIVNSQPTFVKVPTFTYREASNPGYSAFRSGAAASRQAVVYVSANDGMLHAINATNGQEMWAFIPSPTMQVMKTLADQSYNHQYFVDGPTAVGDVNFGGGSSDWHTILVSGMGGGGKQYFALDITDPANPKYLWEFSAANLGFTFGNPSINKLPSGDWAVLFTSGYNNANGIGYLYALNPSTGALVSDAPFNGSPLSTGSGTALNPSNLGKMSAWVDSLADDNTATQIYSGDANGDVWRFDLTGTLSPTVFKLAHLQNSSAQAQPITTRPELALVDTTRVVLVGTGQYLGVPDLTNVQVQSFYAIKDTLGAQNLAGVGQTTWNPRSDSATISGVPSTRLFLRRNLISNYDNGQPITDGSNNNIRRVCSGANSQVSSLSPYPCINETGATMDWTIYGGWYLDFPISGERMNVDMALILGTVIIPTNIPASNACTAGGTGWLNYVDYKTGLTIAGTSNLAGIQVANALIVGINVVKLPSGAISAIVTTSDYGHTSVPPPVSPTVFQGKRSMWREFEVY